MGTVIDLIAYKICRDVASAVIKNRPVKPQRQSDTRCLQALASEAGVIVFYPTQNNTWRLCSAAKLAESIKVGHYTVESPGPRHIRLICNSDLLNINPQFYFDMHFRESLYDSDKLSALLYAFLEEALRHGSNVNQLLRNFHAIIGISPPGKKIKWDDLYDTLLATDGSDPRWWR